MNVSIKTLIHRYAATLEKHWKHDRSKTVGASEIGQCARKTWFSKHDAPRDGGYVESWGAALRGNVIEDHYWLPALRQELPKIGAQLLFAGDEQQTLSSGYLSATSDGMIVFQTGPPINVDNKSIDPRANIAKEKPAHAFQVHTQVGLIRDCTEYKPDSSILSYIDCSFWDRIAEFVIPFNPRIYAAAHARAEQIMTASDALELPPEGKMAGGGECEWCAWASHCAAVTVAGVPRQEKPLAFDIAAELEGLRDAHIIARKTIDECLAAKTGIEEGIKAILRSNNSRRYVGDGWSVSYSTINGRATLDVDAIKAAGIDLATYYKTGSQSERLTIK